MQTLYLYFLQQEKFSLALGKFTRMVSLIESLNEERDLKQVHVSSLILAGHLNVALCYLKLGKYMECIESCDKVICETLNSNARVLIRPTLVILVCLIQIARTMTYLVLRTQVKMV